MLLTDSRGRAATLTTVASLLFLRAVPNRVAELLALFDGGRLQLRADDVLHRRDPVGHEGPFLAVPLLEHHRAGALVVLTRDLHGMREALHPQLVEPLLGEVPVLEAPPHLLAGEGLVAELAHRGPDGLGAEHGVGDTAVVEHLAHAGLLPRPF